MGKRTVKLLWTAAVTVFASVSVASADNLRHDGSPAARDERQVIVLDPVARALVLTEMRQFLNALQGMTQALSSNDLKTVAGIARSVGMQAAHEVPPEVKAKLPMEFKQLGFAVHGEFDQLAMDAESLGDSNHALKQMGGILQKCVACHSIYQIEAVGSFAKK